jgi:putative ABC transport system permease protein
LGFSKENVLILQRSFLLEKNLDAFKQELLKYPDIESVASSNTLISGGQYFGNFFQTSNMSSEILTTDGMVIDEDFIETLGLTLVDGRSFSKKFNDSLSLIINESTIAEFGLKNPIGSKLYMNIDQGPTVQMTIVGVVKDFHNNSLHQNIKAFVFFSNTGPFGRGNILNIKVKPANLINTVAFFEEKWNEFLPGQPITYNFLDDNLNDMYSNEKNSGHIFGVFSLLAIIIAGVGLFGLAAFVTQKRTKEIGIRKVMGSTVTAVIALLSTNFAKLVGIAFVIATPVAFFAIKKWLENFAYQTTISVWIFILAGLLALSIALITISFHTLRVANSNPADSLRYE